MKTLTLMLLILISCTPIISKLPTNTAKCSGIKVERIDKIIRNGALWSLIRIDICGEKVILEKYKDSQKDITWRTK